MKSPKKSVRTLGQKMGLPKAQFKKVAMQSSSGVARGGAKLKKVKGGY